MPSSDEKEEVRQDVGPFRRVLLAFIGLLAGDGVLLLYLFLSARAAWDILTLYAIFSLIGWMLAGLPVALMFPVRVYSRLAWPLCFLIGAILGPLALLLIFIVLFGLQGQLGAFSLAHTESLWPMSCMVSTVAFVVYAALLRRRANRVRPAAEAGS